MPTITRSTYAVFFAPTVPPSAAGATSRLTNAEWLAFFAPTAAPPTPVEPTPPAADVRAALVARLMASDDLTAVVGDRIRPGNLSTRDALPAIAYRAARNPRGHWLDAHDGTAEATVYLDIAAWTLAECVAAKKAVEASLDARSWTELNCRVLWSAQVDEQDLHEPPLDASDRWLYRSLLTYRLKHRTS